MSRTLKANNDCGYVARVEITPCAIRKREMLHGTRTEYGKKIRKAYEGHTQDARRSEVQRLEPRKDDLCNAITTVSKDSLYIGKLENMEEHEIDKYLYKDYGIFKLTPRECLRLQGVKDEDIDKMAAVNSNTQLLKQAGNSICVPVLMAIFSQLHIKNVPVWNELTQEKREGLLKGVIHKRESEGEDGN